MGRPRRQTMKELIEQARSRPPRVDGDRRGPAPGTWTDAGLRGPDGALFARVETELPPGRAVALLRAGALVAWDACGCGGYCGLDWLGAERRRALLRADSPRVGGRARRREWGALSSWRSPDGVDLVLAEFHVRWGAELA